MPNNITPRTDALNLFENQSNFTEDEQIAYRDMIRESSHPIIDLQDIGNKDSSYLSDVT